MRLRKQLLLVSIFTLSLPWVGCQYIGEVEKTLQHGQNQALQTTLNVLRSHVEHDNALVTQLLRIANHENATQLHFHSLATAMRLDGYREEWNNAEVAPQQIRANPEFALSEPLRLYAAEHGDKAWVYIDVPVPPARYYQPGQAYDFVDQIRLSIDAPSPSNTENNGDGLRRFRIVTSSPGSARVFDESSGVGAIEHRIKAYWRESASGYQVEVSMPITWASKALSVDVFANGNALYSNANSDKTAPPTTRIIASMARQRIDLGLINTRAQLAAVNGAHLGEFGALNLQEGRTPPWFMQWIFDAALDNQALETLPSADKTGHYQHSHAFQQALQGHMHLGHYQIQNTEVTSMSAPLYHQGAVIGVLIATQSTNTLNTFTDAAFSKLLMYSVILTMCAAAALVLYASWLSYRILLLRKSTLAAISDNGKVTHDFKVSALDDEIGDLSRSIAELLKRIQEYTEYLRTLSSKLSHELRTPLAVVSSSLDNMKQETDLSKLSVYIERAQGGSERLSQILTAMSSATRVEQAIAGAELEAINVDELIRQLYGAYADAYPTANFTLDVGHNAQNAHVLGSGELIVQMLDKLIDNAVDYCLDEGRIEINLQATDSHAIIAITNPGPHLPEAMREQIFDSLVSLRENTGTTHHLGFGLYIAQLIAKSHQGEIRASNLSISTGARFDGVVFETRLPLHPNSKPLDGATH